jgi:4-amino-4-deoxy-L-arabinose transferase-like glycosyltransferase
MLFTLSFNLILIVLGFFLTRSAWQKYFAKFSRKTWVFLFLIFLISLGMRFFITVPHHEIYIDETWHEEAAMNFLHTGDFGDYRKSIAWPFMLAIFYKLFGFNYFYSIFLSSLFGSLTIFPIYFLARDLSREKFYSFLAPIILTLSPVHIFWSATAETNVVSLFFIVFSFWVALQLRKEINFPFLLLSISLFTWTAQVRGENYFFLIAFLLFLTIYNWRFWWSRNFVLLLIPIILAWGNFVQIFSFTFSRNWPENDSLGKVLGMNNFSVINLWNNTLKFIPEFIFSLPLLGIIFGLAGFWVLFYRKKKYFYFFLALFLSLWIIYFSAWLETLGGRTRFYLPFLPLFSILAVWGFAWFGVKMKRTQILVLAIFLALAILNIYFVFEVNSNSFRTKALRLETELPILIGKEVWHDCLLLVDETKTLSSGGDFNLISAQNFLLDSEKYISNSNCIIFISDWYCIRKDGANRKKVCDKIINNFDTKLINRYSLEEISYGAYAIK